MVKYTFIYTAIQNCLLETVITKYNRKLDSVYQRNSANNILFGDGALFEYVVGKDFAYSKRKYVKYVTSNLVDMKVFLIISLDYKNTVNVFSFSVFNFNVGSRHTYIRVFEPPPSSSLTGAIVNI